MGLAMVPVAERTPVWTISCIRVDLPDPDTPVTTVISPIGISKSMLFRLCFDAPLKASLFAVLAFLRFPGIAISA